MTVLHIYKLEDLKEDQAVAKLHNGEHRIGRDGILNCTDRRVSRNHAIIIITEDKVTLKSIHINPCFYKAAKGNIVVLVQKDKSVTLNDGDQFSLLADTDWFKIRLLSDESSVDSPKKNEATECEKVCNISKTGELPTPTGSCLPHVSKLLNASLEADEAKIDTNQLINNLENIFQEDFGTRNITDKEDSNESMDFADLFMRDTANSRENEELTSTVDGDETIPVQVDQPKKEGNEVKKDPPEEHLETVKTQDDAKSNSGDESADRKGASTSTDNPKPRRERCWYGASCYRKNPVHRTALSHPGDDDYASDPNEEQPVCPFGASCYRTNVDHRRLYKHSAPPSVRKPAGDGQPKQTPEKKEESVSASDKSEGEDSEESGKRRKRKVAKKVKKLNETPEDDYDLDDPFLNDGSGDDFEPSDGDSDESTDWEDSQCVDEESQERKRLLKEAKKFTRAKKRKKT